jgi:glycerol-3-phosphate acyltransferase PlsY
MLNIIFWTIIGFITGSIPFSPLLGSRFSHRDIRAVGDGNPGAANVWKACGWKIGVLAMVLDMSKGVLPVFLARTTGELSGWALVPVSLAPIFGHAFSPFLHFRGGKALATSGGVWLGLAGMEGIIVFAIFTLVTLAIQPDHAVSVAVGMAGMTAYWIVTRSPISLVCIAVVNLLLLIWKHRRELLQPLHTRAWVKNIFLRLRSS